MRHMGGGPAEVRLFAFHHAGGSHALYQGWRNRLPASWDFQPLDAPGHGKLFGQPQIDDLDRIVDHFLERIGPDPTEPYALFGHSMGGLIASAVTRRLVTEGGTRPVWLGLSATRVPGSLAAMQRHTFSDEQLRDYVREMGGTPAMVLEDPYMWQVFGSIIRNDLKLVDSPHPAYDRPLPVPLSVYGGRTDTSLPPEQLAGWSDLAEKCLGVRIFDGGHFYFSSDPGPLLEQVVTDLRAALDLAPPPDRPLGSATPTVPLP